MEDIIQNKLCEVTRLKIAMKNDMRSMDEYREHESRCSRLNDEIRELSKKIDQEKIDQKEAIIQEKLYELARLKRAMKYDMSSMDDYNRYNSIMGNACINNFYDHESRYSSLRNEIHELSKKIDPDKFNQMAQHAHDMYCKPPRRPIKTEDIFDENGKLIGWRNIYD
jgi:NTP pyrophosphatase (non-canonical NTP hydrolase)